MEKQYDKLVRDNIPNIIKAQGGIAEIRTLSDDEYTTYLNRKLLEEVNEYLENSCIEELCDILEVIEAISTAKKFSITDIKNVKEAKAHKNGAFKNKILLEKIIYEGGKTTDR